VRGHAAFQIDLSDVRFDRCRNSHPDQPSLGTTAYRIPVSPVPKFGVAAVNPEFKRWKFAVASIRKNDSGGSPHIPIATADGYQVRNLFLGYLIRLAYVPLTTSAPLYFTDQLIGLPPWFDSDGDRYDVDAKVDEADLTDWQNPMKQPAMLQSMMQAMLEDRLKLAVHRSSKEAIVAILTVGKNGPKFKKTNPDELHPGTRPMPGGGTLSGEEDDGMMTVNYLGITIAQLAVSVLGSEHPVLEKTGLTGKYDFTIRRPIPRVSPQQGDTAMSDPGPSAASIADQLGLKLELSRGQEETLVIDHVERPSPN
jgi:bla regulator protein BlaR1